MLKEYRTLFRYMKPYRLWYLGGFLGLFITNGFQLLIPLFIKQSIDLISSGNFELSDILTIVLYMVAASLGVGIGRLSWRYFIGTPARRIERSIRRDLFSHLMTLDADFYQKNSIGDLMARSTNDMQTIRMSAGIAFVAAFDGIFLTVSILAILFTQTPGLAAYIIIPLPFMTVLILLFGKFVGPLSRLVQEGFSRLSDHCQETFANIRIIKSFVKEDFFLKRFSTINDEYRDRNMKLIMLNGFFFPAVLFLSGLTNMILLLVGGRQVILGQISFGDLVATFSYLQLLIWPMIGAGFTVNLIQRGAVSLERIQKILSYIPVIANTFPDNTPDLEGDMIIEKLSLSRHGKNILNNVSLRIPQSVLIGITGAVGSGKSTLLNCLLRLVDWDEGKITMNGHDIRQVNLYWLREIFGYVPQRSFLFSASLRDNIAFGVQEISDAELDDVIRTASLSQDFKLFPQGWDTVVGEKGVTISGGQKQRSSLARALAKKPSILLLDDPLSAVDADTEKRILTALLKQLEGKTSIIVSHRISTLKHCNTIIVMENGRVAQQGSHTELKDTDGYYNKIFKIQKGTADATDTAGTTGAAGTGENNDSA
ncbi:MAG: ABC transporter ATP-binding protein [Salinispira sp.]